MPAPKIIFLDMDGVLSTPRAHVANDDKQHPDRWIDPIGVKLLNLLCAPKTVRVVVSSVWRFNSTRAEFADLLARNGFTGMLHRDWRTCRTTKGHRGTEVEIWLKEHLGIAGYIILDDESDFHPGQPLIKCDMHNGITIDNFTDAFKQLHGVEFGVWRGERDDRASTKPAVSQPQQRR